MNVKIYDQKVENFIKDLEHSTGSKVGRHIDLLKQFGNQLRMPYSKSLGNNLFELRIRGQKEVRIFYTFYDNKAILLHGFVKKTQNTPPHQIETARSKAKKLPRFNRG